MNAGQRRPREDAEPLIYTQRQDVRLLVAIHEVVLALHRDEPLAVVDLRLVERLHQLPGGHGARADVADLPLLDEVVERRERLPDRRVLVPAVDLVEVDVVGVQSVEARARLVEDVLAGEPLSVRPVVHSAVHLRRDGEFLAVALGDGLPENLLALAVRVDVRRVEEGDPEVERPVDHFERLLVIVEHPGLLAPEVHTAETETRDLQAGLSESRVFHT